MKAESEAYSLTWVTDQLAVGHAPMSYDQLQSLSNQGINAILNLCAEFCDLHSIEAEQGFEVYYMPVPDEEAPELQELDRALAWLDEAIYLGKKVLIHCRHGIGRTGTVLNAYLLRRGLGHKLAGKKLKGLKSKPANFDQWWTIRKFGKGSKPLTIREPSLEFKHLVDLAPFFEDFQRLQEQIDDRVEQVGRNQGLCGRDHDRCCHTPVRLHLVEAVYLSHRINIGRSSQDRQELIERSVATSRLERIAQETVADASGEYCLASADAVCPLLVEGQCELFQDRPFQCRTFDLEQEEKERLWNDVISPAIENSSRQLYLAFVSSFPAEQLPLFPLPEVTSGRYVQTFFHYMLQHSSS